MSKKKAIFVTLVIAAMLAVILAGAYRLDKRIFTALLALLACYGYIRGAGDVCRWMQSKEQPVPVVEAEEVEGSIWDKDDEYDGSSPFIFGGISWKDGKVSPAGEEQ